MGNIVIVNIHPHACIAYIQPEEERAPRKLGYEVFNASHSCEGLGSKKD